MFGDTDGDDIDGQHDPGVTMARVNPESTSVVEPRTPVEVAVDEVLFLTLVHLQLDLENICLKPGGV